MNKSTKMHEGVFLITTILTVLAAAFTYFSVSASYPFYFIWDMDVTTVVDSILIQSGQIPTHINHPGFGMYLWLTISQKFAHMLNFISILNLNDLSQTLNPLLGVAELTDFLRRNSAFVATLIPLSLWLAIITLFDLPKLIQVLILIFFVTQESLIYHSSMIRSELYSVFFWSLSILLSVLALSIRSKDSRKGNRLLGFFKINGPFVFYLSSGVFCGLAFLTKIQSLFYIFTLPLFFMLGLWLQQKDHLDLKTFRKLSLVNLVLFSGLFISAFYRDIPRYFQTFEDHYKVNTIGFIFIFLFLTLAFLQKKQLKIVEKFLPQISITHIFFLGFLLSFLFHFVVFSELRTSLRYMLFDVKMLFMRPRWGSADGITVFDLLQNVKTAVMARPLLYLSNWVLAAFAIKKSNREGRFLLSTLFFLIYLNVGIQRQYVRDILWLEILLNFSSMVFLGFLLKGSKKNLSFASIFLISALALSNAVAGLKMPKRIDANFNLYGWARNFWITATYPGQAKYTELMFRKFDNDPKSARTRAAFSQADQYEKYKQIGSFTFPNQKITLKNIGLVESGFPVWANGESMVIQKYSEGLKDSTVIDNQEIATNGLFFEDGSVLVHSEEFNKFKKQDKPSTIAVLTRGDLKVFLFVEDKDKIRAQGAHIKPTEMIITLADKSKKNERVDMYGLSVDGYSEIEIAKMQGHFFFVIKETL